MHSRTRSRTWIVPLLLAGCGGRMDVGEVQQPTSASRTSDDGGEKTVAGDDATKTDADKTDGDSQPTAPLATPCPTAAPPLDVTLSTGAGLPSLAASPDGKSVVVVYVGASQAKTPLQAAPIIYRVSLDGGATFSAPQQLAVPDADTSLEEQTLPVVVVDSRGAFHIAWIGDGATPDGWVYKAFVASAPAGADHFGPTTEAVVGINQKFIPLTMTASNDGTIVLAYASQTADTGAMMVRTSADGVQWSDAAKAIEYGIGGAAALCADSTSGRVFLAYVADWQTGDGGIMLRASDDHGVSWISDPVSVSAPNEPAVASAVSCAAHGQDVWVGYLPDLHPYSPDGVRIAHSRDGGRTFDAGTSLADTGLTYESPAIASDERGDVIMGTIAAGANLSVQWREAPTPTHTWSAAQALKSGVVSAGALGLAAANCNAYFAFGDATPNSISFARRPLSN